MSKDIQGASPVGDRAVVNGAGQAVSALRASVPSACRNCGGVDWVCENHPDQPWAGLSNREDACGCGAGSPCGACNLRMASASYSEPWRQLANDAYLRGIEIAYDKARGTNADLCKTPGQSYRVIMEALNGLRHQAEASAHAQAIEARRAETAQQAPSQDESAVHEVDAPDE